MNSFHIEQTLLTHIKSWEHFDDIPLAKENRNFKPPDGIWGDKSRQALKSAINDGKIITITKNISLNELLASNTAKRHNIDNMPNQAILQNLIDASVNLYQPVREILGVPIIITSGYRCPALNKAVGGSSTSAHMSGFAIDFTAPKFGTPKIIVPHIVRKLKEKGIGFDQAIIEYPKSPRSWVHLGYKHPSGKQRGSSFVIG